MHTFNQISILIILWYYGAMSFNSLKLLSRFGKFDCVERVSRRVFCRSSPNGFESGFGRIVNHGRSAPSGRFTLWFKSAHPFLTSDRAERPLSLVALKGVRKWVRADLNRRPPPCQGGVIARLDHEPCQAPRRSHPFVSGGHN